MFRFIDFIAVARVAALSFFFCFVLFITLFKYVTKEMYNTLLYSHFINLIPIQFECSVFFVNSI